MNHKTHELIRYDVFIYEDETFTVLKFLGVYVWIPNKIVSSHNKENKTMFVYRKIWHEIYDKAKQNVAMNNLCELYF